MERLEKKRVKTSVPATTLTADHEVVKIEKKLVSLPRTSLKATNGSIKEKGAIKESISSKGDKKGRSLSRSTVTGSRSTTVSRRPQTKGGWEDIKGNLSRVGCTVTTIFCYSSKGI